MSNNTLIHFAGATASPYTRKMVSLLRYRRIPYAMHRELIEEVCKKKQVELPKPVLIPTFFFEEEQGLKAVVDSTPIIRRLEKEYQQRSVLPTDPALAFIDYLIEDFADEWVTKYMFHYRWYPQEDADNASIHVPLAFNVTLPEQQLTFFKESFAKRQISRLGVVGSNESTAPVIEASYRRFLSAMEAHLASQPFMLGNRPSAADFSLFGQLSQLIGVDPSSRAIAHEVSPRAVAWVQQMEDLSGIEPQEKDWYVLEQQPESLTLLLREIGQTYVPSQLANGQAAQAGEKEWACEIDGVRWKQQTFAYQAKCLKWTNEIYQALTAEDRSRVDSFLKGTGIEAMLFKANVL
jgi:glutathione S-transferase